MPISEDADGEARAFVLALYSALLKRPPSEPELRRWTAAALINPASQMMRMFADSAEYQLKNRVAAFFPAGHYHSPVVDPATVGGYVAARGHPGADGFAGIAIDVAGMTRFWDLNRGFLSEPAFPEARQDEFRFHFEGSPFPYGDALTLHAVMGHFRPQRIVEIGSGFSTACMLDSADMHGLDALQITCIEPYPDRLRSLLRPGDHDRVTLLEKPVQDVPAQDIVGELRPHDILFIDSTHVLKTGSDVHYEIFELLAAVRPGVIIHIHDCPYPFEYPAKWIEENYSWNEVYAIRAFLMFNRSFRILFWASLFRRLFPDKVAQEGGRFGKNPGSSLWLGRDA